MPRNKNYTKGKKTIVMIISRGGGGGRREQTRVGNPACELQKSGAGIHFQSYPSERYAGGLKAGGVG